MCWVGALWWWVFGIQGCRRYPRCLATVVDDTSHPIGQYLDDLDRMYGVAGLPACHDLDQNYINSLHIS